MNLISVIPENDKTKMLEYIDRYGINADDFIGFNEYLKYWAESKKKLYHLLGGKLIYEFPVEVNKPEGQIKDEFYNLIRHNNIKELLGEVYYLEGHLLRSIDEEVFTSKEKMDYFKGFAMDRETRYQYEMYIDQAFSPTVLVADKIDRELTLDIPNGKHQLRLSKGMKPMRAIQKILKYFDDMDFFTMCEKLCEELRLRLGNCFPYKKDNFEELRINHSMILNDKKIRGTMCISIHPFDFITMSDNGSKWQSCMNWMHGGCYRIGTVEMMNSNNVLCCYLKAKEDFHFIKGEKSPYTNEEEEASDKEKDLTWNNKRWRQLVYITKDIIVSGSPYPYTNTEMTKVLLEKVRELAQQNLHWGYEFGIERYRDMKHITGKYSMDRAKMYANRKDGVKKNIIFDCNGMYNDMLNKNNVEFWCFRNKVKHTKVISYSGKANCLCCGGNVLRKNTCDDFMDQREMYNGRFVETGEVICETCSSRYICSCCGESSPRKMIIVGTYHLCGECFHRYTRICKCCGKPYVLQGSFNNDSDGGPIVIDLRHPIDFNYHGSGRDDEAKEAQRMLRIHEGLYGWCPINSDYASLDMLPVMICPKCEIRLKMENDFMSIHKVTAASMAWRNGRVRVSDNEATIKLLMPYVLNFNTDVNKQGYIKDAKEESADAS